MSNEYRYGLFHRPAGIGAVPPDKPYRLEPPLADEAGAVLSRHGVVVFERPLSVDELYAYDLVLLADDDLREALAIEVALALAESLEQDMTMAGEAEDRFRARVADMLGKIRLYRVHVGDLAVFSQLVRARLSALADRPSSQDADVLSVLFARSYAPLRSSAGRIGSEPR